MRLVSVETLGKLVVDNQRMIKPLSTEKTVVSYDELSEEVYERIKEQGSFDQGELMRTLTSEGWEAQDIQIAIAILMRRKKITYIGI